MPTIDLGYDAAEPRHAQSPAGDFRWSGYLLLVGITTTPVGVYAGWTSGDDDLRHLSDGPTNGWLPLLSSILALAVFDRSSTASSRCAE